MLFHKRSISKTTSLAIFIHPKAWLAKYWFFANIGPCHCLTYHNRHPAPLSSEVSRMPCAPSGTEGAWEQGQRWVKKKGKSQSSHGKHHVSRKDLQPLLLFWGTELRSTLCQTDERCFSATPLMHSKGDAQAGWGRHYEIGYDVDFSLASLYLTDIVTAEKDDVHFDEKK